MKATPSSRRRARAGGRRLAASTARWCTPIPSPPAPLPVPQRSAAAAASGSPSPGFPAAERRLSRGPQAGQHTGWAWNLRFAGSWYSAAHGPHMAKGAIVVLGRS